MDDDFRSDGSFGFNHGRLGDCTSPDGVHDNLHRVFDPFCDSGIDPRDPAARIAFQPPPTFYENKARVGGSWILQRS